MTIESLRMAQDLAGNIRGDAFSDVLHRAAYSTDASSYRIVPQCVVAPRDWSDVAATVRYAAEIGIPIAPRGAGSGVAGESLCSGIVLDMSRYMNGLATISEDAERVVCQPGMVLDALNQRLAKYRRKIGPDPSSANRATVGGCVANNATGAHCLQYGHIGRYIESMEAVLADGTRVELANDLDPATAIDEQVGRVGRQCLGLLSEQHRVIAEAQPATKRNRSGYNIAGVCHNGRIDLARLMAASEGTLAIFTTVCLRTVPLPAAKGLLQLAFDSLEAMVAALPAIVEGGATACELMDRSLIDLAIDALPQYRDVLPAGAAAALLVEHIGQTEQEVHEKIVSTDFAVGKRAIGRSIILDPQVQARVWKSRKDAGPLLYRRRSRQHPAEFMEDTSVDYTRLGEYIEGVQRIQKKYNLSISFFGHAGDGELHLRPYLDLGDPNDVQKMQAVAEEVFSLVWSLGGSISGEHAIGLLRASFLRQQYGDKYYDILRQIKTIFDPQGIMNPGKILNDDPDVMVKNLRRARRPDPQRVQGDLLFGEDELELELEQCYGCGLCLAGDPSLRMCPVFRATGDELAGTRGKANIINYWASGQMSEADFESPEFRKFLDLCVNCKACQKECPSGVDVSMLISAVRAQYAKRKGLRRAEKLLSNNRFLSRIGSMAAVPANLFMGLPISRWFLEKMGGLDRRRRLPRFSQGTFLVAGRKYLASQAGIAEPVDRVVYFIDTYVNYNDHELGFAVLDILRRNGIEVILPDQVPAPLPAVVYGDVKRARKDLAVDVEHLGPAVRQGFKIICSEPSAALCLREEMAHFVRGKDAELISRNTMELMNYMLALSSQGKLKPPTVKVNESFVYHLPCHLCAVGQEGATIRLLKGFFGVDVVDLGAGCCGLAGTFGMQKKNYELSQKTGQDLMQALQQAKTRNVLTECAACKMQIEHMADCVVTHPAKIIAQCYGLC